MNFLWKTFQLLVISIIIISCDNMFVDNSNSYTISTPSSVIDNESTIDISSNSESVSELVDTYNIEDIVSNITFVNRVVIDLTNETLSLDGSENISFLEANQDILTDVTISSTSNAVTVTSNSSSLIIYELSGNTDKTLIVDSEANYQLYLNNITITSSNGPAILLKSEVKTFIVSAPDSTNTLSDSSSRTDELDKKASLYSKGSLIFSGTGSITVNGDYKHGIYSKDYIRILEGYITVSVTKRDAIQSLNGFIFDDGNLTITATGTVEDDESKGIKVKGDESALGAGYGYIVINGGTISITSVSKGITASWDRDEDAETADKSDDPNPDLIINNGIITITTTGESYETSTSSCSPEGIEAKDAIIINDGYIIINSVDDGINAGSEITINGGYIYAASSDNDAIDSNGDISITGGYIVAIGSTTPECGIDCDNNDFTIEGGTIIALGGSTSSPTSSSQNTLLITNLDIDSGEILGIKSSDKSVFAYSMPTEATTIIVSSPDIESNISYSIYSGSSATADTNFKGLYIGNISFTTNSILETFTATSNITSIGSVSTGGGHSPFR